MDINFYSDLSDGCAQNVDSEFLDSQAYGGYPEENKFAEGSDSYLTISGAGHPFLSAETFHTPSLGDEVFEIPPISLDPDPALGISDAHFELTDGSDGTGGSSVSRSLVSNLVVEANDPSFASTFVNSGSQGLEQLNLGSMGQAGGGALLSSSALEMGNSSGSHFSSSSPMTIDVQLGDIGHSLLGSSHLSTINQSELALGLGGENMGHHSETPEQPLSATPSPAGSLQDEDMDDFKRSVLVDSPMSLSSSSVLSHLSSHQAHLSSISPVTGRRGGGKPATLSPASMAMGPKKGRKKKDPNEPQKPVSAYALFFRDTQAAIKGQNPNASFGEVSKIVASMWDSLAEEQKQVYKRKTEVAKREYLKALAAYRANQLSQPGFEEMETAPSPPPPVDNLTPTAPLSAGQQAIRLANSNTEENTITNICVSNIILDVPERTTRSRTGANKASTPATTAAALAPPAQTITKIIIPKHILQAGGQLVTVLPGGGVRTLQPTLLLSGGSRQPPPLQQMQNAPPPPRLQQMAPAPPPLQAKPREGSTLAVSVTATPPPPLQIKIVPASLQGKETLPIIVPNSASASSTVTTSSTSAPIVSVQVLNSADVSGGADEDEVTEVLPSEEEEMEVTASSNVMKSVCVRAGCNNPAVESEDWDKEYCSNECVATHCRDIFQAWCSIRNQNIGTVK
uniref:TOX high mobility group box family member 4-A-like isoform X2 n=1 Tax=Solea senegalensis TaxID=28829 RepID=UPI001CD81B59|nr:TOX high mobility group box family member 4-A-like isoform X2 [Solea senegalensis]